jgi:hypothetical protein
VGSGSKDAAGDGVGGQQAVEENVEGRDVHS